MIYCRWFNAKVTELQCISNEVTSLLHQVIDAGYIVLNMHYQIELTSLSSDIALPKEMIIDLTSGID